MDLWFIALLPFIGALIGYVTNWVAIRMLFRPYEEKRIMGMRVPFTPGLIPKRRDEMAGSIGRSVSNHLLTEESIGARLMQPTFRKQIEQLVDKTSANWLRKDLDSVNELVPAKFKPEWQNWKSTIKSRLGEWVANLAVSPELHNLIEQQTEIQLRKWLDTPLEDLLPQEFMDEAPDKLATVLQRVMEDESLQDRIDDFFARGMNSLVEKDQSLSDFLPDRLREVAYEKMHEMVPVILGRMVNILEDVRVRKRIKVQLFELVDELLNKQFREESVWDQFKYGLMESFVISPEDLKARIEDGVDQAAPRFAEMVRRDDVQEKVYQAMVESIDKFLDKKISEFHMTDETRSDLRERFSKWLTDLLKSETLHEQLVKLVSDTINNHREKTLREILPDFSDEAITRTSERASAKIIEWLQSDPTQEKFTTFVSNQVDVWMDKPLGRLDRFIPDETMQRGQIFVSEQIIAWLVRETPLIVEKLDVQQVVADQVDKFSLPKVEAIIMGVTGRQLKAITWFGALLGFVLGLAQFAYLFFTR